MPATANFIKDVPTSIGSKALYQMTPPHQGHEFVVVSAVDLDPTNPMTHLMDSMVGAPLASCETYIFPADRDGSITSWGELSGSIKDVKDHAAALAAAGYDLVRQTDSPTVTTEEHDG